MKLRYWVSLLVVVTGNSIAASVEDIINYSMQGVSLAHPIDTIHSTVTSRGFTANAWPKDKPGNWKFEKRQDGSSEVYEVHLDRDGAVKSIRYQKSVPPGDAQSIDMGAEYNLLSGMATGKTDNCNKYPGGGFQCVLHAGDGPQSANLSARTGHGTVYFSVSR